MRLVQKIIKWKVNVVQNDFQERSECCDPYIKVYLCPERRFHNKTKIHKKTLDPEFNEMFSFDAPYSTLSNRMLQVHKYTVFSIIFKNFISNIFKKIIFTFFQFTVYDFDRFKRHDLIGNIIMRDLFEKSDLYSWTEYTMQIIADIVLLKFFILLFEIENTIKYAFLRKKMISVIYYCIYRTMMWNVN